MNKEAVEISSAACVLYFRASRERNLFAYSRSEHQAGGKRAN
jgi:hypothetical protein